MAAGLKYAVESCFSKVWEKFVDYGFERVTGKKDSKFKLETLQRSLNSLSDKACDINEQIIHGEQLGKKKRKREVENWLKEVQKLESELGVLQNHVQEEGFLSRFFSEDRVPQLDARVHALIDQSHHFGELLLDANEMKGERLLTSKLIGEAFEKNIDDIWKWLVIDKVKSIGIYGMGGVGKTTSAKHINNRLLEETQFSVYWVTVSQVFTINKLQSDMAKVIGLDLSDEENEDKRARRLNRALSQKEFVLILDDVWSDIDLEKMGDPLGVEGCRLIVTTRSLSVCQRIACQEIMKLETLQTDESWTLFREIIGERIAITSEVEEIAKCLAKECDGLPLGIIVLAKSMKGVTDIHKWRHVYDEIRESPMELHDMDDKVFRVLKYSFNRLDPKFHEKRRRRRRRNGYTKLQLCFLYCSLYPEDFEIDKDELVRRFISEELVDTRKSLEKQLDQGYTMQSELLDLCLLESTGDSKYLKMHDLVRDMALSIARESPKYKVFAGLALKEIPNEEEWTEDVDKISLMRNEIKKIPPEMAPNCPKLATLLLNKNPLVSIPESFFAKMSGLCILDLSRTLIRELPNSLLDLESLNTLLLNNCRDLVSLPFLGKLKALRELDLSNTSITWLPNSISDLVSIYRLCLSDCRVLVFVPSLEKLEALTELDLSYTPIKRIPEGMENLINLKILSFRGTKNLKLLPGDLPLKSQNLQHLELPLEIEVPVYEIEWSKQLRKFVGRFKDVSDYNWFQSQTGGLISEFSYLVQNDQYCYAANQCLLYDVEEKLLDEVGNMLFMRGCSLRREGEDGVIILPQKIQGLNITECKGLSRCLLDDFKPCSSSVIKVLRIDECEGIESIWNINDQLTAETTIKVKSVYLWRLPDLKGLVNWEVGGGPEAAKLFSSLQCFYISNCNKMKTLGLPLPWLHNIKEIWVDRCDEIEEVIELVEEAEEISEPTISLPNLEKLTLDGLPKLKSICKARIDCKSIKEIQILGCPRVKKLPLFLPSSSSSDGQVINYSRPSALRRIMMEEEMWESLEWDDIRHKHLLQPFFKFW